MPQDIGQELLNVPFPEMIRNMGLAIAEAQHALDMVSMRIAPFMAGRQESYDEDGDQVITDSRIQFGTGTYSLLELGFTPTFYQFVDTIIEVKISISISSEASYQHRQSSFSLSVPGGIGLAFGGGSIRASTVSASCCGVAGKGSVSFRKATHAVARCSGGDDDSARSRSALVK